LDKIIGRIKILDLVRGFFLFVIIVNHINRFPNGYGILTGQGILWVSAAEGFFFVTGMMLGLIRGRKDKEKPFSDVLKKILKRTGVLYVCHVLTTFIFMALAFYYVDNPGVKQGLPTLPLETLIIYTLTLHFSYGWSDFLLYYVIYLLASPIFIFLLRKGYWWLGLTVSVIIWAIFRESYFTLTWQILFFSGCLIGYYLPEIMNKLTLMSQINRLRIMSFIVSVTILTAGLSIYITFYRDIYQLPFYHSELININDNYLTWLFERPPLWLPRLILFYFWFCALLYIFYYIRNYLPKFIEKFLLTYGQNSLFVFITHSFVVYFIDLYISPTYGFWTNFYITTSALSIIWFITSIWESRGVILDKTKKFFNK
jgi:hypothetical protein